jgi:hypothetical protein
MFLAFFWNKTFEYDFRSSTRKTTNQNIAFSIRYTFLDSIRIGYFSSVLFQINLSFQLLTDFVCLYNYEF